MATKIKPGVYKTTVYIGTENGLLHGIIVTHSEGVVWKRMKNLA